MRFVGLIKFAENALLRFGRDFASRVADMNGYIFGVFFGCYKYIAVLRSEFYRIVENVYPNLL